MNPKINLISDLESIIGPQPQTVLLYALREQTPYGVSWAGKNKGYGGRQPVIDLAKAAFFNRKCDATQAKLYNGKMFLNYELVQYEVREFQGASQT